jgi:hypothetical protein
LRPGCSPLTARACSLPRPLDPGQRLVGSFDLAPSASSPASPPSRARTTSSCATRVTCSRSRWAGAGRRSLRQGGVLRLRTDSVGGERPQETTTSRQTTISRPRRETPSRRNRRTGPSRA